MLVNLYNGLVDKRAARILTRGAVSGDEKTLLNRTATFVSSRINVRRMVKVIVKKYCKLRRGVI